MEKLVNKLYFSILRKQISTLLSMAKELVFG